MLEGEVLTEKFGVDPESRGFIKKRVSMDGKKVRGFWVKEVKKEGGSVSDLLESVKSVPLGFVSILLTHFVMKKSLLFIFLLSISSSRAVSEKNTQQRELKEELSIEKQVKNPLKRIIGGISFVLVLTVFFLISMQINNSWIEKCKEFQILLEKGSIKKVQKGNLYFVKDKEAKAPEFHEMRYKEASPKQKGYLSFSKVRLDVDGYRKVFFPLSYTVSNIESYLNKGYIVIFENLESPRNMIAAIHPKIEKNFIRLLQEPSINDPLYLRGLNIFESGVLSGLPPQDVLAYVLGSHVKDYYPNHEFNTKALEELDSYDSPYYKRSTESNNGIAQLNEDQTEVIKRGLDRIKNFFSKEEWEGIIAGDEPNFKDVSCSARSAL